MFLGGTSHRAQSSAEVNAAMALQKVGVICSNTILQNIDKIEKQNIEKIEIHNVEIHLAMIAFKVKWCFPVSQVEELPPQTLHSIYTL